MTAVHVSITCFRVTRCAVPDEDALVGFELEGVRRRVRREVLERIVVLRVWRFIINFTVAGPPGGDTLMHL